MIDTPKLDIFITGIFRSSLTVGATPAPCDGADEAAPGEAGAPGCTAAEACGCWAVVPLAACVVTEDGDE